MKALTDADRAIAAGDELAALDALITAWQGAKAPAIAELADRLGQRLEDALEPPFTGTRDEHHAVWMAIFRQRRAVDWPLLLRSVRLTADRFGAAIVTALIERATMLRTWGPDPRTTPIAIEMLRRPGYESSSSSTYPLWTALCDLLVEHGDPRAADQLAKLDYRRVFNAYSDRKKAAAWFAEQQHATLARLRALPTAPVLSAADADTCAKLARAIAAGRARKIDDALRARLAREPITPKAKPSPKPTARAEHDRAAMEKQLAAAAVSAAAGDDRKALDQLIAAWRASRSIAIAELVDAVASRLAGQGSELVVEGKRAEMQAAWLAVAKHQRSVDLPALAEAITNTHGRSTEALARVKALARWDPDPRTGPILARHLHHLPFDSSSTKPFWTALLALAIDHGDARTLAALEAQSGTFVGKLREQWRDTTAIARWFENQVASACTALRARPAALEPDDAICKRIAASLGSGTVDRLYAEIAANPEDDGLRAVLGDLLQQKGDPRGELIALQLAGKQPERAAELVAKHARTWLGTIGGHVVVEGCTFARGFPETVMLATSTSDAEALAGNPTWATVRRLYVGDMGRLPEALLRTLRLDELGGLSRKLVRQLLAWPEVPYRSLGTTYAWQGRDREDVREALPRLPHLRALRVFDHPDREWLWTGWAASRIDEVGLDEVVDWDALLNDARVAKTPRILARDSRFALELPSAEEGELRAIARMPPREVNRLLASIGRGTLTHLATARPTADSERRSLDKHARRIGFAVEYD